MNTKSQTIQFDNGTVQVFPTHAWVYTTSDQPVVGYRSGERRWHPFQTETDAETNRQITHLSAEEAAARCGATASLIRQIEAAAAAQYAAAQEASGRQLEEGRRAWAAKSQDERDALNDYAIKTEGHTID